MADDDALKDHLRAALKRTQQNILWKLEGLSDRDLRLPRTPTGFNLLGAVKHIAQTEYTYLGETFSRPWPNPDELITSAQITADPQADWYATADESTEDILGFYARVRTFGDETIRELPLDAVGTVPHWPMVTASVTLGQIVVHLLIDITRHLGQIDIVREGIDGKAGLGEANPNLPENHDWAAYTAKLTALADGTR
ncbi:DinB family protein [Brevibacterium casei]